MGLRNGPGRWPSDLHIVLFLGRCPRLVWAGPLALGIALLPFSWGVAPGWYGAGRWPLESHYYLFPGALPQAGMGRAVGPGTAHRPFPGALPQAGIARAVGPCAWLTLGRVRALKPRFIWATASRRSRPSCGWLRGPRGAADCTRRRGGVRRRLPGGRRLRRGGRRGGDSPYRSTGGRGRW